MREVPVEIILEGYVSLETFFLCFGSFNLN